MSVGVSSSPPLRRTVPVRDPCRRRRYAISTTSRLASTFTDCRSLRRAAVPLWMYPHRPGDKSSRRGRSAVRSTRLQQLLLLLLRPTVVPSSMHPPLSTGLALPPPPPRFNGVDRPETVAGRCACFMAAKCSYHDRVRFDVLWRPCELFSASAV